MRLALRANQIAGVKSWHLNLCWLGRDLIRNRSIVGHVSRLFAALVSAGHQGAEADRLGQPMITNKKSRELFLPYRSRSKDRFISSIERLEDTS